MWPPLGAADLHSAVAADYLRVEALMTASRIIREAGGDPCPGAQARMVRRRRRGRGL